ncbi:ROK family transcriptional regulator [Cellulomonas denverensis]|uniref:ROK family transcriptional regulator n=1 Tax=Cellulomonas denverensis TaxID=264297 RepID=A0A7X6KYB9_9CELL|nr:ROK family transcriptional regulator [Cellulomonas denverensis]NKY24453.1 ROK family transcriptional regulator [Cellulomonas denverensis]GIG26569.1 sugar kinase [Cellulomonas denverensis]
MTTRPAAPAPAASTQRRTSSSRSANVARVLDSLRAEGPTSQATLARRTGLAPATVNSIVKALREDGRAEIRPVNGREAHVALVSSTTTLVAAEVMHDAVRASAYAFTQGHRFDVLVPGSRPEAVTEAARAVADASGTPLDQVGGVAVAVQAPIERSSGAVAGWVTDRLPEWRGVPLRATFERALGVEVLVDNNVNFAALAEWSWGVGRGVDDFLYVHAGQGVGGGLVIDGSIYHGGSGMAGVLGHIVLEPSGEVCYCGSRGCLTTLVSEAAILAQLHASHASRDSLRSVIAGARDGDPACQRVVGEAGRHLGRALANAAKVVAPSVIAIGGSLGTAGRLLFEPLASTMAVNNLRLVAPATRFRPAHLHQRPAMLGGVAALLAEAGQGLSDLPAWASESAAPSA